jgi:hypothetical protein
MPDVGGSIGSGTGQQAVDGSPGPLDFTGPSRGSQGGSPGGQISPQNGPTAMPDNPAIKPPNFPCGNMPNTGPDGNVVEGTPTPGSPPTEDDRSQVNPAQPAPPLDAGGSAIIVDPGGGASSDEGPPSMSAAPSENFVAGTWNNLMSAVSEFFTRDAAREYETAMDPWGRLDVVRRNTLLNKLYHHVTTPVAAGAGDAHGGMAQLLGDTPGTLERLGSSAYAGAKLLYNDPQAVGEAAYHAYDDFNHLTPTQQNDAYLRFASSAFTNKPAGDFLEAGLTGAPGFAPKATFLNQLPERLAGELADAAKVGVKPIRFGDPAFNEAVNGGTIKYIVTESGEVLITPHTVTGVEISHAVLSNGQNVVAAGEAEIAAAGSKYVGIDLNYQSGHFMPTAKSLQAAREAFAKISITFP